MATEKIKIVNGQIFDGTGSPGFKGEILLEGDVIIKIGEKIRDKGDINIDATGQVVAPGFIDMHTHTDLNILINEYSEENLMQGVTTDVVANCGIGLAPSNKELVEFLYYMAKDLLGGVLPPHFKNLYDLKKEISGKGHSHNLAFLIPQGNIRALVMEMEKGEPTKDQMDEMKAILDDNLAAGAFGLSTGLIYPPGSNSSTRELIELAKVVKKHGGFYASHVRNETKGVLKAIGEAIKIGKGAGVAVQISHIKVVYFSRKAKSIIKMVNDARASGLDVTADLYPYLAGCTSFGSVILPTWVFKDGIQEIKNQLKDEQIRKKIINGSINSLLEMVNVPEKIGRIIPKFVFKLLLQFLSKDLLVTFVKNDHELEGKSLKEILNTRYSNDRNVLNSVLNFIFDEDGCVTTCMFGIDENKTLIPLMKQPWTMISTDAYPGHPRSWGTYPRIFKVYVREKKILALPQAIYKMTGLPAKRLKLQDRGILKQGFKADIVIFNPEKIEDQATYERWNLPPKGISHVIVNGKITVKDGTHLKIKNGQILSPNNLN
ncbi:MAG: N-acyl-D-amino-acid deacylase family protein [Promethearchaeota archaeon]